MLNTDLSSLISYDMKDQVNKAIVRNEEDIFKKIKLYRNCQFTCDSLDGKNIMVNNIYKELWDWNRPVTKKSGYQKSGGGKTPEGFSDEFKHQWKRLGPDTMNSFKIIRDHAYSKIYNKSLEDLESNKNLRKFALLTHTIGNFTLVPYYLTSSDRPSYVMEDNKVKSKKQVVKAITFDQSRGSSGKYFVKDMFDLSLKIIKENTSSDIFKEYIDKFFLNMYVDKNYNIIPLLKSNEEYLLQDKMDLSNPLKFMPSNEAELNEYLENVNNLIEMRSKLIVEKLKMSNYEL